MKKIIIAAVAVALVLSIGATSAFANGFGYHQGANVNAQNATTTQTKVEGATTVEQTVTNAAVCPHYADEDGDGVCDHCVNSTSATASTTNNTAIAQGTNQTTDRTCTNYIDANGDGVCDNCTGHNGYHYGNNAGNGIGDNATTGHHYKHGDHDGTCDGMQYGHRG